jgi:hypothetical protein
MLWLFRAGAALAILATLVFILWPPGLPLLRVSGADLLNASNDQVILHGVDTSGTGYDCVEGHGIFVGPTGQASATAMKNWGVNAVRLPLNEACWNGESYVDSRYSGKNYQRAIEGYVRLLNDNGISVILDLQWTDGRYTGNSSDCSSAEARSLLVNSFALMTSVAGVGGGDHRQPAGLDDHRGPVRHLAPRDQADVRQAVSGYRGPGTCQVGDGEPRAADEVRAEAIEDPRRANQPGLLEQRPQFGGCVHRTPFDPGSTI